MSGAKALKLASRVPVFPCDNDKTPLVAHGFKDASNDADVIRKWWDKWPDALIGVPAGIRFVVIDLDLQHEEARQWCSDNSGRLPPTRTHRTRSGGLHLLFAPHPDVKCTTGKLHPHVDTRGDGGYVIWWPAEGHEMLHHGTLAPVPDWILEGLRPKPANIIHFATARPVTDRQAERQLDGIIRTITQAPMGQRNAIVFWGACRLWELVKRGDLSEGCARRLIISAGTSTGLSTVEVERAFDSASRRLMGAVACR
jgi:hypothetical protein